MPRPTKPAAVARFLAKARNAWQRRAPDAAERALRNALALAPGDPDAIRMLGVVVQYRGDHAEAAVCFRRVIDVWPDDAALRIGFGLALFESGAFDAATRQLRHACKLAPSHAPAWFNLGEALWRQDYAEEAMPVLERAVSIDPTHVPARLSLARVHASLGHTAAALSGFRAALRLAPDSADAWYGLSLNAVRFDAADLEHLQLAFARTDIPLRDHELLGFTLAKAWEQHADYAHAYTTLQLANASQHARSHWDAAKEHATVEATMRAFAAPLPATATPYTGHEVIFVTGLPRSGSTLVEHILASHPEIEGANEIKDMPQVIEAESRRTGAAFPDWAAVATTADWQRLGGQYLAQTERWRRDKPRFTDKNLRNWHFVGALLAMLPDARIIIVRRDPVETCLACFRQCLTDEAGFACSLDETADYCVDFLRLARFWLDKFPLRVLDLQYESLVAEPEAEIRRMLRFCGLPFDPACLNFHATARAVHTPSATQVRQPIRRDTARSALYGNALDGLRERLGAAGVTRQRWPATPPS